MKLYYQIKDSGIEVIRCFGNDTKVVLPEQINGVPVTAVAAYAFSDRKEEKEEQVFVYRNSELSFFEGEEHLLAGNDVEEIVFPATVREIGNYIFYGCKHLRKLEFYNTLMHIGSGAFTGCSGLQFLTVHMAEGNQSCVKEILGELWQRIDVVFHYEETNEKAVLVFPEHYEEAVENTPARILFTQHHGSGNNYRQCFYNKEIDYRKYDSLFSVAAARDKAGVLADIAFGRLKYPYQLSEKDRLSYQNLIRTRCEEIIKYLIEKESFSGIKVMTEYRMWSAEMLEYALEVAARQGKTEILSYLMNEKQNHVPKKPKKFVL